MKVTFRYDLSDAHRVGELVGALTAGGFNFEAEFLPVLPVPVQEEVLQEPELPSELVQPLDQAAANAALLEAVYPLWSDEDDDGHDHEGDDDPLEAPYLPFSQQ